jgi:serine/threonine protein kinase
MSFELNNLRLLNHPNIISFINSICYEGRCGIVLEFCENGTLEQLLTVHDARFLTEPVAQNYFGQIGIVISTSGDWKPVVPQLSVLSGSPLK